MRVQSGIHGPTLLLPDVFEDRAAWDDVEIECGRDNDGTYRVAITRHGEVLLRRRLTGWYKEGGGA